MKDLADAWKWYEHARQNLERMRKLAKKHWDSFRWETDLIGKDDDFRTLEARDIEEEANVSLEPIDDLAIVVLFSVFESLVRKHVEEIIKPEAEGLVDPILRHAAKEAIEGVKEGSFYGRFWSR
jgi:hypothetical protein